MKPRLSPYTIASNCTDLTDIRDGINEIQDEIKRLVSENKDVPNFFYSRLSKLQAKRMKYEQKNQVHMNVTVRFSWTKKRSQWQFAIACISASSQLFRT